MNWTCLVYGAPMLGILIWWFISARKWFKGPKVNIEHQMLGREGNVLEAKDGAAENESGGDSTSGSIKKDEGALIEQKVAALA